MQWEENETYQISYMGTDYQLRFMRSSNLPAVFVDTQSGSLDYLNADKRNSETGRIRVVQNTGNSEYVGSLEKVSKRGQATSGAEKISLSFSLENKKSLCGLEAGKKWNLLSLYFERNKIQTKIVYDMADYLGMEYTSGSAWVDLYCNGEYEGLYLLTEAVTVGDGRVELYDLEEDNKVANSETDLKSLATVKENTKAWYDIQSPSYIQGGYLIEKKYHDRLAASTKAYFETDRGMSFEIEAPRHPSQAEVEYISDYVQKISNLLVAGDDGFREYLDMDSFAKQFLIDAIVLDGDGMCESTFFYLDEDGILKSGPLWDYDMALGAANPDYTAAIGKGIGGMQDWYVPLYENVEYKEKLMSYYRELLPCIAEFVSVRIDKYAEWISDSLKMDAQRWGMTGCTYMSYANYDSYIRYLKWFLLKRTECLNREWGIDYIIEEPQGLYTEEVHTVTFLGKDGSIVDKYQVKDGEGIEELPDPGEDCEYGWTFWGWYRVYDAKIPVFEDITLTAR